MRIQTINPANEEVIAAYDLQSTAETSGQIGEANESFRHWRETELDVRLQCVKDFAEAVHSSRMQLAELMTREMGKTLKESLGEVDKCANSTKQLAEYFPRWRSEVEYSTSAGYSITRQPLGVILGIMPWNFPLWQVVRFAVPTLLCGNSILLKHAPNTWGSAEFIGELFRRAFPDALYTNIRVDLKGVEGIIADARVRGVSLTGSRRAGMSVAQQAGAALKKCVLELGGSDAYVVLDDADIDKAAEICTQSRMINGGQSCVSAKRFIVTRKNAVAFTEKMRTLLAGKKFGDPSAAGTDFGPLARRDLRDQLHTQVEASVKAGAKLVLGGKIPDIKGFYYPATMLVDVRPGQAAFDDELFGPVAAVITADDEMQAIALANQSRYGLGGAIFSRDTERAKALATTEMEAGMVFINDFVRSEASVPFGGVKDSGLGRELGRDGCFEFTNIKSVYLKHT